MVNGGGCKWNAGSCSGQGQSMCSSSGSSMLCRKEEKVGECGHCQTP